MVFTSTLHVQAGFALTSAAAGGSKTRMSMPARVLITVPVVSMVP